MSDMNRREFTEALALVSLVPFLGAGSAPSPSSLSLPLPGSGVGDPGTLARALVGAIRAQYGDRLSEADLAVISRQIESSLERVAKVRSVPLSNGDEPDFVFSAVRGPADG